MACGADSARAAYRHAEPGRGDFLHFLGETADFLAWLGRSEATGPINACSDGSITIGGIIRLIEEITGKQAVVHGETPVDNDNASPFGIPSSWVLDNGKAKAAGFRFEALTDWLPQLVRQIAAE